MRLVKEDILNIDKYLKNKGIKYMDVRYELIDHLVSEYEQLENYPDLESFLRKRVAWCRQIAEEKRKSVHWGYQKALWQRIFSFIKEPIFYTSIFLWAAVLYFFDYFFESKGVKFFLIGCICFIVVAQFAVLYKGFVLKSQINKNVLSFNYLFNTYSLPHLLLHLMNIFNVFKLSGKWFWISYITIVIIINIAALIEVSERRKKVIEEYAFLKTYFS